MRFGDNGKCLRAHPTLRKAARGSAIPRHEMPELHKIPLPKRGRRECRVLAAPIASRVKINTRVSHHRFAETLRHSLRDGFTAYIVLSPVTGLSCHRRHAGLTLRNLTPASGRQDHTTSPSAFASLALRHQHVHRIPHPTSVAIARTPLFRVRDGGTSGGDLPDGTSEIFLREGMDKVFCATADLPVGQITRAVRR